MSEIGLLKGVRVFYVSQGMAQGSRRKAHCTRQEQSNETYPLLKLYALRLKPYASSAGKAIQL
jgi:hypothetical protein